MSIVGDMWDELWARGMVRRVRHVKAADYFGPLIGVDKEGKAWPFSSVAELRIWEAKEEKLAPRAFAAEEVELELEASRLWALYLQGEGIVEEGDRPVANYERSAVVRPAPSEEDLERLQRGVDRWHGRAKRRVFYANFDLVVILNDTPT